MNNLLSVVIVGQWLGTCSSFRTAGDGVNVEEVIQKESMSNGKYIAFMALVLWLAWCFELYVHCTWWYAGMFYRRVEEGGSSHDGPQRWSGGAKQVRGSVKSVIFNCSVKSLIFKSVKYGTFNSVKSGTFNSVRS